MIEIGNMVIVLSWVYPLLGVFVFGVILRIFKMPLLGIRTHSSVYACLGTWWNGILRLLTTKPNGATPLGFLLTPIWPCFVGLNVILLAQVFEIFFPGGVGGRPISFPLIGKLWVFPLIMGTLFAVGQTILGIIFHTTSSEHKHAKTGLILSIIGMILVETILAAFKAYSFMDDGGGESLSSTIFDQAMRKGPMIAGLLGFFVPIVEVVSGATAWHQFVNPISIPILRWIGGGILLIGYIPLWWLYGFPLVILPQSIVKLKKDTINLLRKVSKIEPDAIIFRNRLTRLSNPPDVFDTLQKNVEDIKGTLQDSWARNINPAQLTTKRDILRKGAEMDSHFSSIISKCDLLEKKAEKLLDNITRWNKQVIMPNTTWSNINNRYTTCQNDHIKLNELYTDIENVLGDNPRLKQILSPNEVNELNRITPEDKPTIQNEMGNIRTEITNTNDNLSNIKGIIDNLQNLAPLSVLPVPTGAQITNFKNGIPPVKTTANNDYNSCDNIIQQLLLNLGVQKNQKVQKKQGASLWTRFVKTIFPWYN